MNALSPVDDHFEVDNDERDYSARLDDVLGNSDQEDGSESDSEGFVYDGDDAEPSGPYREQLSEILEQNFDELDEIEDDEHVGNLLHRDAPSPLELAEPEPTERVETPSPSPIIPKFQRPGFLHPNVSRLRSYASRIPSSTTVSSASGLVAESDTPSRLSRASSPSNLNESVDSSVDKATKSTGKRAPFRWSTMKSILALVKSSSSVPQKAANVLGRAEAPTVMASNGLICIGTTLGRVLVFDFKQNLKAICATKNTTMVTAIALSQDRTFVAMGHLDGHIFLFDLADTSKPARSVATNARAAVVSGRREGHLHGSRITHINFVGARHTAIVTTDEYGLAFYHSLGKVLFVDATDERRLLGKYPEDVQVAAPKSNDPNQSPRSTIKGDKRTSRWFKQSPSILSSLPLPLGTVPHHTDSYNIVAIITSFKLVIVALKPSPKTWLRKRRVEDRYAALVNGASAPPAGCIAWYPSVSVKDEDSLTGEMKTTHPILLYTWGPSVRLIQVREELAEHLRKSQKRGIPHEQGRLLFDEVGSWTTESDIRAVQWLNPYQVIVALDNAMEVWDIRDGCKRLESAPFSLSNLIPLTLRVDEKKIRSFEQAVCAYKGKVFLLGNKDILVGTLLSWTDHILSLVERGDSLSAIELATAYHLGTAPGNQNGLPRIPELRKKATGTQLRELMQASVRHAFSPDRLTDATHRTEGNRGVDRTALFEGLVPTCVHACLALDDLDFIYEELFENYDNVGIAPIFLRTLEPFLLDGTILSIPPWITQRLIAMHEEAEDYQKAEALIWHLDPMSLDINQAIRLCRGQDLWDALIYVYTRALRDYVAPVVELLSLVRAVQRLRQTASTDGLTSDIERDLERDSMNAYKIFPYIAATLSGQTYPSQTALPKDEALIAKRDLYDFLVDGRSRIWPKGPQGKLVLTADEDGGPEPTYPYLRLLLRFDPEAMLHTLDIAFEDSYLNDDNQGVGRLIIIKILLEMLSTGSFPPSDATLVRIFVAKNVPKYPQYIKMPPSLLHSVLIGLASDPDVETREDRQLAAEYLLSTYKPREGDDLNALFEEAGFYRILRTRFRAEKQWSSLLDAYLQDVDIPSQELFQHLDQVLILSTRRGVVPPDVVLVAMDALSRLLDLDLNKTALFIDKRLSDQHQRALEQLQGDDQRQLLYLRTLLQPEKTRLAYAHDYEPIPPSKHVDQQSLRLYFELLCRADPSSVIEALDSIDHSILPLKDLVSVFKQNSAHDAVLLTLEKMGKVNEALDYVEATCEKEAARLTSLLDTRRGLELEKNLDFVLGGLERMANAMVSLCQKSATADGVAPDERWLRLVRSQILLVQQVADDNQHADRANVARVIEKLRGLVNNSFDALLLHSSAQGISFPRLFRDLVSSTTQANKYSSKPSTELYAEFRMILTGMLHTYQYEGELLGTTAALVNGDVNEVFEEWTRRRELGWKPAQAICANCERSLVPTIPVQERDGAPALDGESGIKIAASGQMFHVKCPA